MTPLEAGGRGSINRQPAEPGTLMNWVQIYDKNGPLTTIHRIKRIWLTGWGKKRGIMRIEPGFTGWGGFGAGWGMELQKMPATDCSAAGI